MHLAMEKVLDKNEVKITIYAEPIKILSIEGNSVLCEWEGRRWRMHLSTVLAYGILSDETGEEMRGRFLARLNRLLQQDIHKEQEE